MGPLRSESGPVFAMASRRIFHLCGGVLPKTLKVLTLTPLGARDMDGLQRRPTLVYPTHTMIELAHQALVHKDAFALKAASASGQPSRARSVRSEQWRWQPIYKCMPPPKWHANPDQISEVVNLAPRRRLTHKRPWQATAKDCV